MVALLGDAFHSSVATVSSNWRAEGSINSTDQEIVLGESTVTVLRRYRVRDRALYRARRERRTFQFSIFRTDPYADLKVRLVDLGADGDTGGGNDSLHEVIFSHENGNAVASGEWVNLEILSDLTGLDGQSIGQIVVSVTALTTDGSVRLSTSTTCSSVRPPSR